MPSVSIVVPCYNHAHDLRRCLDSLFSQTIADTGGLEIVVVLNGCSDESAAVAKAFRSRAKSVGAAYRVLSLERPCKAAALNLGDAACQAPVRVYLDADVTCDRHLMAHLLTALDTSEPRYATGTINVTPARSRVTRIYAGFWTMLARHSATGIGLYAVNEAGRARWRDFPQIHSDDKFVRLNFAAHERIRVSSHYSWPLPEGWHSLLRSRRRWSSGNGEIRRRYPDLVRGQSRARQPMTLIPLVLRDPIGFVVFSTLYVAGRVAARFRPPTQSSTWHRARG